MGQVFTVMSNSLVQTQAFRFRIPDGWKTDVYSASKPSVISFVPENYNSGDDSPMNHKPSAIINVEISDKPAHSLRYSSIAKLAPINCRFGKVEVLHLSFPQADHEQCVLRLKKEIVTVTLAVARPNESTLAKYDSDFRSLVSSIEIRRQ